MKITRPQTRALAFGWALGALAAGPAHAVLFFPTTITGSTTSYTANVAYQLAPRTGTPLVTATGVLAGGTSLQGPNNPGLIVDNSWSPWQLMNMSDGSRSATMTVTLNQEYDLNKITTTYGQFLGFYGSYQLAVSPDGSAWTTVKPQTAVPSLRVTDTFVTQTAKYIQWTVYGPGVDFGGEPSYNYPTDLQAFVAATSAAPPLLTGGYNIIPTATILSSTGPDSLAVALDGNVNSYVSPSGTDSVTIDLGQGLSLYHIGLDFVLGQTALNTQVEFSMDNVNWTTIVNSNNITSSAFTFAPTDARYIRLTDTGGAALGEFSAFAMIPEPSTVLLAGIGGGLLWRRRSAGK